MLGRGRTLVNLRGGVLRIEGILLHLRAGALRRGTSAGRLGFLPPLSDSPLQEM